MTDQELIDYYVNLLIMQFHESPNAKDTVDAFVKEAVGS